MFQLSEQDMSTLVLDTSKKTSDCVDITTSDENQERNREQTSVGVEVERSRVSRSNAAPSASEQEQARVSSLLLDTVALLCKNGLTYRREMKIQGTLGITLDDDSVFVVQINESVSDPHTPKHPASASAIAAGGSSKLSERSNLRKRQADFSPSTRAPADKRRSEVIVIGDSDQTESKNSKSDAPEPPRKRFVFRRTTRQTSVVSTIIFVF